MNCPQCGAAMQHHELEDTVGRPLGIDLCQLCQSFWFDGHESLQLAPAATLTLFRVIGEQAARPESRDRTLARCSRCNARLQPTSDVQRATRFEYAKCPQSHGRLMSFVDFLKAKDFIKPMTPKQIAELRENVAIVNCSNCGSSIDLGAESTCRHCGSALSMLDLAQAEKLIAQLRGARSPGLLSESNNPAGREHDRTNRGARIREDSAWFADVAASGVVGAGLHLIARWLKDDV